MHKRISKRLAAALFLSSACVSAPVQAEVTVGTPTLGGFCYPFGCGYTGEYQQVYGASAFSGPIEINTIEFFPNSGFALNDNSGSFTLAFYLTSRPVDGLSTNPATNETVLLSDFGVFTPGTSYVFTGSSFTYDPSLGNLLLSITTAGAPGDTNALDFSSTAGDAMSNLFRSGGTGAYATSTNGIVTRFSATAVPEPSTWALMLLGFCAVGAFARQGRSGVVGQLA